MSNCDFIRMQPISKSDMYCLTCGHLFDEYIPICTCYKSKEEVTPEYLEAGGKIPIRNVVPFKQYIKDKYKGK